MHVYIACVTNPFLGPFWLFYNDFCPKEIIDIYANITALTSYNFGDFFIMFERSSPLWHCKNSHTLFIF